MDRTLLSRFHSEKYYNILTLLKDCHMVVNHEACPVFFVHYDIFGVQNTTIFNFNRSDNFEMTIRELNGVMLRFPGTISYSDLSVIIPVYRLKTLCKFGVILSLTSLFFQISLLPYQSHFI